MKRSALPTLVDFSNEYVAPVFKSGLPSLILYTNDNNAAYNQVYAEAAEALASEIMFVRTGCKAGI